MLTETKSFFSDAKTSLKKIPEALDASNVSIFGYSTLSTDELYLNLNFQGQEDNITLQKILTILQNLQKPQLSFQLHHISGKSDRANNSPLVYPYISPGTEGSLNGRKTGLCHFGVKSHPKTYKDL